MKVGESFSALAHILNFGILLYFINSALLTNCMDNQEIIISFIGLFAALVANIISVIDNQNI